MSSLTWLMDTGFGRGAIDRKGYGSFNNGPGTKRAHVVCWRWHRGPVPPGLELSHTCHVRHCVNPFSPHVLAETHARNLARRAVSPVCPQGHDDWWYRQDGKRECRPCCNARRKRYPDYRKHD